MKVILFVESLELSSLRRSGLITTTRVMRFVRQTERCCSAFSNSLDIRWLGHQLNRWLQTIRELIHGRQLRSHKVNWCLRELSMTVIVRQANTLIFGKVYALSVRTISTNTASRERDSSTSEPPPTFYTLYFPPRPQLPLPLD